MRIEEFTQQGFEPVPEELKPIFTTPKNSEANVFIKPINNVDYMYVEENGADSKIGIAYGVRKNAGFKVHMMNLNIE